MPNNDNIQDTETQAKTLEQKIKEMYPLVGLGISSAEHPDFSSTMESFANAKDFPAFFDRIIAAGNRIIRTAQLLDETIPKIKQIIYKAVTPLDESQTIFSDKTIKAMQIFSALCPYIEKEADEHPEKYTGEGFSTANELLAAAARRAREDGQDIPVLRAEEAVRRDEKENEKEPSQKAIARDKGAIMSLNGHVSIPSNKDYQDSFTSSKIKGLPGSFAEFEFDEKDGRLYEESLAGKSFLPVDQIHGGALMSLLQIANIDLREYNSRENSTIGVYVPGVLKDAGIDYRPRIRDSQTKELVKREKLDEQTAKHLRLDRFLNLINPFENRVGYIPGEGWYSIAKFVSWDEKTEVAYIAVPYEIKIIEKIMLYSDGYTAISEIFHANIVSENPVAIELANRIAVGVIERGVTRSQSQTYKSDEPPKLARRTTTKTDKHGNKQTVTETFAQDPPERQIKKTIQTEDGGTIEKIINNPKEKAKNIVWECSFQRLINDCPQLSRELRIIRNGDFDNKAMRINKKLKDVFDAAIRIITTKSDMPHYYKDLKIRTVKYDHYKAPTSSTLNNKLIISHKGKNEDFQD